MFGTGEQEGAPFGGIDERFFYVGNAIKRRRRLGIKKSLMTELKQFRQFE